MKTIGLGRDSIFSKLLLGVLTGGVLLVIGCIAGVILGILSGTIAGYFYSLFNQHFFPAVYASQSLDELTQAEAGTVGMPIGLLMGLVTAMHHAIFRPHTPSWVWVVISGFGAIAGLELSSFGTHDINQFGFMPEVAFVAIMVGWPIHLLVNVIMSEIFKIEDKPPGRWLLALGSVCGFMLISVTIYQYFIFWIALQNIPS